MRVAEWINLIYFSFFILFVLFKPFPWQQRSRVIRIGFIGITFVLAGIWMAKLVPLSTSILIRDWLPAVLIVLAYWQPGALFIAPNEVLQAQLASFDQKIHLFLNRNLGSETNSQPPILSHSFELAYLACYPLVPFGLAILYWANQRMYADEFWATVLISAYLCYAMVPFTQTLPPRLVFKSSDDPPGKIRIFNHLILNHASIQTNTLPSAHVAASLAVALITTRFVPVAGFFLLPLAILIAISAAAGRYHYVADVLIGAGLSISVFLAVTLISH
jgi:hypothetical protein